MGKEVVLKKILIGLVIVLVVIGAIILFVFTLTGGLPRSADQFFTLIREGKAKDAYLSGSREFQASASEEDFAAFLKSSTIADYESASWSSRSISGKIGELEGSIKTRSGGVVPIKLRLIKEDGKWKIHAIEKAAAGLVKTPTETASKESTSKEPTVPSGDDLKAMTNASMLLLARAINTKNFSELYNASAKVWQSQTTAEALKESFIKYTEQNVDLTFVEGMSPEFKEKPSIDNNGILILKGSYPARPAPLNFTVKYIREESEWKLVGIFITMEEAPADATSAANKKEIPSADQVVALTNRSMMLLAQAVSRDDFSDFYGSIAKLWQQQITKDKLREQLVVFIEKKISLTIIEGVTPVFSEKPYLDKDGLLVLKGRYPTQPYWVEFELDFFNEESQWKLLGFNVVTRNLK
jgi:hypothetical protein